jgi:hypothetical protein
LFYTPVSDRGFLVLTFLNQNVNFITIVIDGPPKVVHSTVDLDKYLIMILGITKFPWVLPNLTAIPLPEFITPISDSFVTNGNASC